MSLGIVGIKCGMTRIFSKNGDSTPVTAINVERNVITQVKTLDHDGYNAIQVTAGFRKRSRLNKAQLGHFLKSKVEPGYGLWEFNLGDNYENISSEFTVGKNVGLALFSNGQKVDVTSISKGKGFQGVVKRHNFSTQDATHGNSLSHRVHGSTGQNQTPGRVFKNKKMAGQMGNKKITVQNLKVIKVDEKLGLILSRSMYSM
jgi:large subunit ribosomal protein L3